MKIKTLQRTQLRAAECPSDVRRSSRNLSAAAHPHARAREYTRAVTAAKFNRMFAQPLVAGNFGNGHGDSVTCAAVSQQTLLPAVSGSANGTVCLWNVAQREQVAELPAHRRVVQGVVFDRVRGEYFYSVSDDGHMHRWSVADCTAIGKTAKAAATTTKTTTTTTPQHTPTHSWKIDGTFQSVDHTYGNDNAHILTASDSAVQVWTPERTAPLQTFPTSAWGHGAGMDTVTVARCHPVEHHLAVCTTADRGVGLLDCRTAVPLQKCVLRMKSNDVQWNPAEPICFLLANEDHCLYYMDMRKLDRPCRIYRGHVGAVLSCAFSPTGREFASGSYDKTIRLFDITANTSRDVYHTKRMQRVTTVQYTADGQFVISGSDESNLRLWKADASRQLGQLTVGEQAAHRYRAALLDRYRHMPAVRRIYRARKTPKVIQKQTAQRVLQKDKADRKLANRIQYDKTGTHRFVGERDKVVVKKVD